MKRNIYKAFAIIVYIRSKGTSSKSVAAKKQKKKKHIQETVIEERASAKRWKVKTSKESVRWPCFFLN